MSTPAISNDIWLWLAIAGLGLFHGINPAMGWLFAVALGLNRRSERIVWLSLLPIGLGHALAIALVLFLVLALGLLRCCSAGLPGMRFTGGVIKCGLACRSGLAVYSCGHS